MSNLIDTVLEQIVIGDCIVFINRYGGVSYKFMQVIKKNPKSFVLRELVMLRRGSLMYYECMPGERDDFAKDTTETVRLKLCGDDAVSLKLGIGYYAFLYDKNNHLDIYGKPYQPDVYDRTSDKLYEGCCD